MTVLSALLVFGSIAAFATLYATANHEQSVLVVTQTIEQGQPIRAGDLGQASAAISGGVEPILVSDASELSGRRAAVTIPAGSLLTIADTTATQPIAPGDAVVGMALKPGQLPAAGVEPGEQVMIVETGAPGTPLTPLPSSTGATAGGATSGGAAGAGVLVPQANVFDVQPAASSASNPSGASSSAGDAQLVSVEVSDSLASDVSTAAAAGQVSLVLLPGSTGDSPGGKRKGSP
jgi:hypothetical protein